MENYVAKRSAWSEVTFLRVILCILIIPIFYLIYKIIECKKERWEINANKAVHTSGILNKRTEQTVITGILAVNVEQSLKGRIFNFGDIVVDIAGKNNMHMEGVAKPYDFKKVIEEYIESQNIRAAAIN